MSVETIQGMAETIAMLEEKLAKDDWVSVSEGLPEEYDQYLCYCADDIYFVYWLENKPWAETRVKEEEIIAWRPLTAPYKEKDTNGDKP